MPSASVLMGSPARPVEPVGPVGSAVVGRPPPRLKRAAETLRRPPGVESKSLAESVDGGSSSTLPARPPVLALELERADVGGRPLGCDRGCSLATGPSAGVLAAASPLEFALPKDGFGRERSTDGPVVCPLGVVLWAV